VESCMALMTARRFRHLPVLDGEKLVGVISIGDVVKQLMLEKDMTIKSLEDYIWVHMI
ncbi:MAG: CBS domain-containing protein, partial [Chloroflexota bacterium]